MRKPKVLWARPCLGRWGRWGHPQPSPMGISPGFASMGKELQVEGEIRGFRTALMLTALPPSSSSPRVKLVPRELVAAKVPKVPVVSPVPLALLALLVLL